MYSQCCLLHVLLSLIVVSHVADGSDDQQSHNLKRAEQEILAPGFNQERFAGACPDYRHYATVRHRPYSSGPLALPFQRPSKYCRTFTSEAVERVIEEVTKKMVDKDLARIFENAFPNTLDTTIRWHVDGTEASDWLQGPDGAWEGPQSFIVTGDINAEWLRDSTNQLAQYQDLAKHDSKIQSLILGAINTQAEYVIDAPYCNAFQPPPPSREPITSNAQEDFVHPAYEPTRVFECKYELDSLAHFLALGNQFHNVTTSTAYLTSRYYTALQTLMQVIEEQSEPSFDPVTGKFQRSEYTFRRKTTVGTETLSLAGIGNPLASGTGLVRSAFRPSDDATVFGYFIPANAQMSVELKRTAAILKKVGKESLAAKLEKTGETIEKGIWQHGVVEHKLYGRVFAFEVDGYGSSLLMDDANIPSLLALPLLGFVTHDDETYQNTRKMVLDHNTNPYLLRGSAFSGVGGPHIGPSHAWPMSRLVQALTSDDETEIKSALDDVKNVSCMGLINEGINVWRSSDYTRSWFAWANSVFSQVILDLARRKPQMIFGPGASPYSTS